MLKYIAYNLVSKNPFLDTGISPSTKVIAAYAPTRLPFFPTILMILGLAKVFIHCPGGHKIAL